MLIERFPYRRIEAGRQPRDRILGHHPVAEAGGPPSLRCRRRRHFRATRKRLPSSPKILFIRAAHRKRKPEAISTRPTASARHTTRIYQGGKLTRIQPRRAARQYGVPLWLHAERLIARKPAVAERSKIVSQASVPEIKGALEQGIASLLARDNDLG